MENPVSGGAVYYTAKKPLREPGSHPKMPRAATSQSGLKALGVTSGQGPGSLEAPKHGAPQHPIVMSGNLGDCWTRPFLGFLEGVLGKKVALSKSCSGSSRSSRSRSHSSS